MTIPAIPYSDPIRLHQIGAALTRRLEPDVESRSRIARALDLKSLDRFVADIEIVPTVSGWRMSGRVQADAVQSCVLTLEPLSVAINEHFTVNLTETPPDAPADEDGEIDLELDDNSPDVVENGQIDLGQYAVEQLSLHWTLTPARTARFLNSRQNPVKSRPSGC